jgi:uncharacterized membrane protein
VTIEELLLLLHVLGSFWYVVGLSAVQLSYTRATQATEYTEQAVALEEAAHYQGVLLVPGAIAIGSTGIFYWSKLDYNVATTGWLLAVEGLYLLTLFVCLPVIGIGLRRARVASLKARRAGGSVPELEAALQDNAPLLFGGLATILVPVMAYLSISHPF